MNRIPLSERLSRIKDGKLSDPAIVANLIRMVLNMPMHTYLGNFRLYDLANYLGFGDDTCKAGELTYGEVVSQIHQMWDAPEKHENAVEAMWILIKPYYIEYKRGMKNAKNQS